MSYFITVYYLCCDGRCCTIENVPLRDTTFLDIYESIWGARQSRDGVGVPRTIYNGHICRPSQLIVDSEVVDGALLIETYRYDGSFLNARVMPMRLKYKREREFAHHLTASEIVHPTVPKKNKILVCFILNMDAAALTIEVDKQITVLDLMLNIHRCLGVKDEGIMYFVCNNRKYAAQLDCVNSKPFKRLSECASTSIQLLYIFEEIQGH